MTQGHPQVKSSFPEEDEEEEDAESLPSPTAQDSKGADKFIKLSQPKVRPPVLLLNEDEAFSKRETQVPVAPSFPPGQKLPPGVLRGSPRGAPLHLLSPSQVEQPGINSPTGMQVSGASFKPESPSLVRSPSPASESLAELEQQVKDLTPFKSSPLSRYDSKQSRLTAFTHAHALYYYGYNPTQLSEKKKQELFQEHPFLKKPSPEYCVKPHNQPFAFHYSDAVQSVSPVQFDVNVSTPPPTRIDPLQNAGFSLFGESRAKELDTTAAELDNRGKLSFSAPLPGKHPPVQPPTPDKKNAQISLAVTPPITAATLRPVSSNSTASARRGSLGLESAALSDRHRWETETPVLQSLSSLPPPRAPPPKPETPVFAPISQTQPLQQSLEKLPFDGETPVLSQSAYIRNIMNAQRQLPLREVRPSTNQRKPQVAKEIVRNKHSAKKEPWRQDSANDFGESYRRIMTAQQMEQQELEAKNQQEELLPGQTFLQKQREIVRAKPGTSERKQAAAMKSSVNQALRRYKKSSTNPYMQRHLSNTKALGDVAARKDKVHNLKRPQMQQRGGHAPSFVDNRRTSVELAAKGSPLRQAAKHAMLQPDSTSCGSRGSSRGSRKSGQTAQELISAFDRNPQPVTHWSTEGQDNQDVHEKLEEFMYVVAAANQEKALPGTATGFEAPATPNSAFHLSLMSHRNRDSPVPQRKHPKKKKLQNSVSLPTLHGDGR